MSKVINPIKKDVVRPVPIPDGWTNTCIAICTVLLIRGLRKKPNLWMPTKRV